MFRKVQSTASPEGQPIFCAAKLINFSFLCKLFNV